MDDAQDVTKRPISTPIIAKTAGNGYKFSAPQIVHIKQEEVHD